jgi:protein-tyrosine phosphatase
MTSILVVCTGNVCRSPMAEGFLRSALVRRFGRQAPVVSSAGTLGWEGSGAMPEAVQAAAEREVDIRPHRARRLGVGMIGRADLAVCMAQEHREEVSRLAPDAYDRTFTLKELARVLEHLPGAGPDSKGEGLSRRVAEAAEFRRDGFRGNPFDEDIADPLGLPIDSFRAVAWELDEWCDRLAVGLFGKADAPAQIFDELA